MGFKRMSDLRAANAAAGHFFFSRGAMRAFNSRIESALYDGRVFITSESMGYGDDDHRRMFAVREAMPDGKIETLEPEDAEYTRNGRTQSVTGGRFTHLEDARQYALDYVRGVTYVVQTNYGYGAWEDSTASDTELGALADLKACRDNQPEFAHRIHKEA